MQFFWGNPAAEGLTQDHLPTAVTEATYLINFAQLKSHEGGGITLSAKNHYGSLIRTPLGALRGVPSGYFNLHDGLPGDGYRGDVRMTGMGRCRALVDLIGSRRLGGKSVLYLVDAIFAGKNWKAAASRWALAPFDGHWPSSSFVSISPVAIDSIGFDFLSQQWPDQLLQYEGAQDYLHEAAQADSPSSGTCCDPERDGVPMASLGVHERWINAADKHYTRNLGSGDGLELVYLDHAPAVSVYIPLAVAPQAAPVTQSVYIPLALVLEGWGRH